MPDFHLAGLSALSPFPLSRRQRHSWLPPNPIPSENPPNLRRRSPSTSPSLRGRWLGLAPFLGDLDPQHLFTAQTCRLDFHSRLTSARNTHTHTHIFLCYFLSHVVIPHNVCHPTQKKISPKHFSLHALNTPFCKPTTPVIGVWHSFYFPRAGGRKLHRIKEMQRIVTIACPWMKGIL